MEQYGCTFWHFEKRSDHFFLTLFLFEKTMVMVRCGLEVDVGCAPLATVVLLLRQLLLLLLFTLLLLPSCCCYRGCSLASFWLLVGDACFLILEQPWWMVGRARRWWRRLLLLVLASWATGLPDPLFFEVVVGVRSARCAPTTTSYHVWWPPPCSAASSGARAQKWSLSLTTTSYS